MTENRPTDQLNIVKLLSLLLAALLWLAVTLEHAGEVKLRVPVVLENAPAGLLLASAPPDALEATVSGPRVLLLGPWLCGGVCRLDLSGAQEGTSSYRALDCSFDLGPELKVVRIQPSTIRLVLAKAAPAPR